MIKKIALGCCMASAFMGTAVFAQECTPQEEARNAEIVAQFPSTDVVSPSYIQHNPAFKKRAMEAGMSDYNYMLSVFGGGNRGRGGPPGGGRGPGDPAPDVPQGTRITMVDCDMVTTIRSRWVQDPNEPDGVLYEQWGFDTFRVEDGMIVEHWDSAMIQPEM